MTTQDQQEQKSPRRAGRLAVSGLVAAAAVVAPLTVSAPAHAEECFGTTASCIAWGAGSKVNGPISRAEVHDRMKQWLGHTSITYSQSARANGPGGWGRYRRDCSGFVSMALHISPKNGGANTVTLRSKVKKIHRSQLRFGDLIGRLGPGTEGDNGHVQIFIKWANKSHTKVQVAEQGWVSNPNYPHKATHPRLEPLNGVNMQPYRYKNIR